MNEFEDVISQHLKISDLTQKQILLFSYKPADDINIRCEYYFTMNNNHQTLKQIANDKNRMICRKIKFLVRLGEFLGRKPG
jgi:hypothetical protein